MMPRRISRVPPRKVQDGACNTVSASASSNRSSAARRRPGARRAHELGDLALERSAEVLDQRRLEFGVSPGLQHAGDRQRHLPQGPQMRGHAADRLGDMRLRIGAGAAHQLDAAAGSELMKALGPAALEGELAGHLPPAVALLADQPVVRHEHAVEHDLVEVVLAGEVDDRPDRDARRLEVEDQLAEAAWRSVSRPARCAPG